MAMRFAHNAHTRSCKNYFQPGGSKASKMAPEGSAGNENTHTFDGMKRDVKNRNCHHHTRTESARQAKSKRPVTVTWPECASATCNASFHKRRPARPPPDMTPPHPHTPHTTARCPLTPSRSSLSLPPLSSSLDTLPLRCLALVSPPPPPLSRSMSIRFRQDVTWRSGKMEGRGQNCDQSASWERVQVDMD